jgi:hypothetical protein
MHIDEGHYGDVKLDGITVVATFFFPRALHQGGGQMQPVLPSWTTPEQRDAVFKIMSGEGQPPNTIFQIFHAIVETIHEPQFTDITFEWNIDKRTARIDVPGIVRARTEPIRNPVTTRSTGSSLFYPTAGTSISAKALQAPQRASARSGSIMLIGTAHWRPSLSATRGWPTAMRRRRRNWVLGSEQRRRSAERGLSRNDAG